MTDENTTLGELYKKFVDRLMLKGLTPSEASAFMKENAEKISDGLLQKFYEVEYEEQKG